MSAQIDPRGPQFGAAVTSVVLAVVLLTATTPVGVALLAGQAALFATGVLLGVQRTPTARVFRRLVRPRLAPPTRLEDARPPRFAQGMGLGFAVIGLVGFTAGPMWLGYAATGLALVAALLNATVQLCLGCRIYGVCGLPTSVLPTIQHDHQTPDKQQTPDKKEVLA